MSHDAQCMLAHASRVAAGPSVVGEARPLTAIALAWVGSSKLINTTQSRRAPLSRSPYHAKTQFLVT